MLKNDRFILDSLYVFLIDLLFLLGDYVIRLKALEFVYEVFSSHFNIIFSSEYVTFSVSPKVVQYQDTIKQVKMAVKKAL